MGNLFRRLSFLQFSAIFVAVLGLPFLAAAQQTPWGAGPFAGEPKEILKAAASISSDKYPHVTVLLEESVYSIDESRRITRTRRLIYRIDSPKALQSWGRTSVYWEPWHQDKPELKARIITSDGSVFWLDEKTLSDSPARRQSDDIYTDTRYLGGPLPGIAEGAIVEEFSLRRDKEPLFEAGSIQRYGIGAGYPVAATRLVVEYSASLPLKTKVLNLPNLVQHREENRGRIRLIFEHGRIEAQPPVPDFAPPETFIRGVIQFTTALSWKDVNATYYRDVADRIRTADVTELVKQTIQPGDSRDVMIAKLVTRLHKEVRYTGIEFGEAAIIPRYPAETLGRRFGDCKDKSALLVAMLRAAGIPASLALVRTVSPDIDLDIPGFGLFDHAIVFVPGTVPVWIDATAEYNVVGNLPSMIRGKQALVIDGKTDRPILIPVSLPSENKLTESREFFLAEYGPAKIRETGQASGFIDAGYRSYFSGPANKNRKEALEAYGKNVYLTEAVGDPKLGDGRDLQKPFKVELEFTGARRGFTELDEAVAAIKIDGLFSRMPRALTAPAADKKNETDPVPPRKVDFVFEPFQVEWHYQIHPPSGFSLHAALPAVDRKLGAARLTETWQTGKDGTLEGVIRFDTVKGRYSVEEADATREAIALALKEPAIVVRFDNVGSALIAKGKIREGLAEYERVSAAEPKRAIHRIRLSRALLQAGLGEQARIEAQAAVNLDPTLVLAHANLGWILEHDILGRRFEHGFDRDGAIAAYKKAIETDPKDVTVRASLGIISEFNKEGERYGQGSLLPEAIAAYESLKALDKDQYERFEINLVLCLLYSRNFEKLQTQLGNRAGEDRYRDIAIAAAAASSGSEAALLQSSRLTSSQQERSKSLREASQLLLRLRQYKEAADLLEVAAQGADNAANLQNQVELFRRTKRAELVAPSAKEPSSAVHVLFVSLGTGVPSTQVMQQLSRSWRMAGTERLRNLRIRLMRTVLMGVLGDTGLPNATVLDVILSNTEYSVEGDEHLGYRVWVRLPDTEAQPVFVVREEGQFRVAAFREFDALGWEALSRLKSDDTRSAAKLLDWARQQVERGGGEDPLSGSLFARFWDKGSGAKAERNAVEAAALALVAEGTELDLTPDVERVAALLPESKRTEGDQLRWQADINVKKWAEAAPIAARLFAAYPQSETGFLMQAFELLVTKRFAELEKLARQRLEADSDDEEAIGMLSEALVAQDRTPAARELVKTRIKMGRAKASELNSYAWAALFTGVDDEALEIARKSSAATSQSSYAILHTLACLYAEVGKTAEARELMLKAMESNYLEDLDSALWYVYGRIAEQYGQEAASRAAYARVEKPEPPEVEQGSTYRLAALRLASMDAKAKQGSEKRADSLKAPAR